MFVRGKLHECEVKWSLKAEWLMRLLKTEQNKKKWTSFLPAASLLHADGLIRVCGVRSQALNTDGEFQRSSPRRITAAAWTYRVDALLHVLTGQSGKKKTTLDGTPEGRKSSK